ncbi:N-acetylmuramoyl-L-alanine amidase [Sphingorhabdus sp. YGSMI21]|uniref:peptidoglycan recognition protein family protein n=1 Tax=Sphingorhabdus sp. YGSMI21 TaxID=2077182 RepID=UPI000C1DE825|nr:N-acetylmuramoyl-L-alanine amidase [Sphingorhabdus sp. YGSMI21]ATW05081.1 peptidoglycan-binding protein [Sphingorhabdus sp. YGSMI21]
MAYQLTWMPRVLRQAGLKVAETPGWIDHGRGNMRQVRGVICHHTAGARNGNMPSLRVLVDGRSDLKGPLCHLGLGRDGTYYLIAAGSANHAGHGRWKGFTNGGSGFIGIEAENVGDPAREKWPDEQIDAYIRGVAALFGYLNLPPERCCSHREWALPSGRKVDPHSIDMDDFRRNVGLAIDGRFAGRPMIPAMDQAQRPTLRRGARGVWVEQLQTKLELKADGIFGPLTEAAVRQYQRDHDLVGDGIVGPLTWAALNP